MSQTKDPREKKWAKQRKERGFDDRELWAMDSTITSFILPRLKAFAKHGHGYPAGMTSEEWDATIQTMIDGFEEHARRNEHECELNWRKIDKGLKLFAKHYGHLWN